ncbi:MAG: GNAT family N-acetyltransferase [Armatimonadetes bacterium]|nr:GNAT family N-acetyltransferase [Armatimonadota bacterium]
MLKLLESMKKSPSYVASGQKVVVRQLGRQDLKRIKRWFANLELVSLAFGLQGDASTLQRIADDYYREIFWWQKNALAIDTLSGECIGFMKYTIREDHEMHAKVGILIGERPYWEHGYGTEAMQMLLRYLFENLKVDRVELDTAEFNTRAQRSFEKCGFRKLGAFAEVNHHDGRSAQKIWMSMDRAEYERVCLP